MLEVGGDRIEVDGWRGMIGHNWGAEHAERWVWIQGSGFEGHSPEDYFDMAVGRIKVAGRTTPWVGNAMLMLDGRSHRLGGFGHVPEHRGERAAYRRRLRAQGQGREASPATSAPRPRTSSPGSTPTRSGPEHNTLNCSISDLLLDVEVDGGPAERLTVRGAAAYEFGTRDTDHGIPVQPYPDG